MLAPYLPYISGIAFIVAIIGIFYSFYKKKYSFLPSYILLVLSALFIGFASLPQNAGDWGAIFYILLGVLFLVVALIVFIVTFLIKLLKGEKIEEIK